ncbi:MAG: RimK/LysX family protein [Desulfuromonadales bacterium]|nr:RimK/LysX family protein [Desulfuromonadales bacterium]
MKLKTTLFFCFLLGLALSPVTVAAATKTTDALCTELAGFSVIGELENVTFREEGLRLKARIDTGAETSSLGVASQQKFERDGKKWIQFTVEDPASEKVIEFERPLIRIAKIKRHGAEALERPVVKLKITLGAIDITREFTLADRTQYAYPTLIGRNVLSGKFLVDVNRKFSASRSQGSEE